MPLFEIKSWIDGRVLFSLECPSLKICVEAAVKAKANLRAANLRDADLCAADLRDANLRAADLRDADLCAANLCDADLRDANLRAANLSWQSHAILSEILWRAAAGNQEKEQLAAWIGRKTEWCWPEWLRLTHPHRDWALAELRKWVKDGDDAPDILRAVASSA